MVHPNQEMEDLEVEVSALEMFFYLKCLQDWKMVPVALAKRNLVAGTCF